MNFNKRGFYRFLAIIFYAFIVFAVIALFVSLLPVILLLGLIIWKVVKIRNRKKQNNFNPRNYDGFDNNVNLKDSSDEDIIDVEYKEVKK